MKALLIAVLALTAAAHYRGKESENGHGRHHHHPPMPPFLKDVDKSARKEFFAIVKNKTLTIAEQKAAVLEWGECHGIKDEVEQFQQKMASLGDEIKKNVAELISKLPAAFQSFSAVMENENQTRREQKDRLKALKDEQPKVFNVLKAAFHQFKPKNEGPGKFVGGRRHRRQIDESCPEAIFFEIDENEEEKPTPKPKRRIRF
ncbi:hypothetical protein Q1695_016049 [Nippostrongylus brasiliensis]|nr:hypothetical protein Q1695_016049 [Nippostrongylus brasiliensis]